MSGCTQPAEPGPSPSAGLTQDQADQALEQEIAGIEEAEAGQIESELVEGA